MSSIRTKPYLKAIAHMFPLRCQIEVSTQAINQRGEAILSWQPIYNRLPAKIEESSINCNYSQDVILAEQSVVIRLAGRYKIELIHRVVIGPQIYKIKRIAHDVLGFYTLLTVEK